MTVKRLLLSTVARPFQIRQTFLIRFPSTSPRLEWRMGCGGYSAIPEAVTMYFPLKTEKTIQAIGVLFRQDGVRRMNYMRLLKLLSTT